MARLDLLMWSGAIAAAGLFPLGCSCSVGPIWAEGLHGRVVDHETKQPVEGVEVFISAVVTGRYWDHGPKGTRWGTTDENGEFVLKEEFQMWIVPGARTSKNPAITLYHPAYGVVIWTSLAEGLDDTTWTQLLDGSVDPGDSLTFVIEEGRHDCAWDTLCTWLTPAACEHLKDDVHLRDPNHSCAGISGESRAAVVGDVAP